MVRPALFLFGLGFGVFTVGGVALLMAVNTAEKAASYLALWSVIQLVSRGLGSPRAACWRDLVKTLTGDVAVATVRCFSWRLLAFFYAFGCCFGGRARLCRHPPARQEQ